MTEVLFWKIAGYWWLAGLASLAVIAFRADIHWWAEDALSAFLALICWPLMVSMVGTVITMVFWFIFFYEVMP